MNFNTHLLIVSVLIVVGYGFWHFGVQKPAQAPAQGSVVSRYSISISQASWGVNCQARSSLYDEQTNDGFSKATGTPLKPNNVFRPVSQACNGKVSCDITRTVLGPDPDPECPEKLLEVEYRCFAYDRPWKVRGFDNQLTIDCRRLITQ